MAHSNYLRRMARLLRVEQQLSVDQLALRLALPRSTVYYWVRDLPLRAQAPGAGKGAREVVVTARGVGKLGGRSASRSPSEAAYEDALRSFDDLDAQPTFRDFVCLYIARGCTRERTKVSLSDSDPAVIRLVNRWMLRLTDKSPLLSIQYEPGQSLTELRRFWGAIVGAEARTIRVHGEADRGGEHGPAGRPRHGVLTVAVDDTLLRARLQAWMRKTRDSWR
jgi:transposase-like protein